MTDPNVPDSITNYTVQITSGKKTKLQHHNPPSHHHPSNPQLTDESTTTVVPPSGGELVLRSITNMLSPVVTSASASSSLPAITTVPVTIPIIVVPKNNPTDESVDTTSSSRLSLSTVTITKQDLMMEKNSSRKHRKLLGYGLLVLCFGSILGIILGVIYGVGSTQNSNDSSSSTNGLSFSNPTKGVQLQYNLNISKVSTYDANTLTDLRCSFYNTILKNIITNLTVNDPSLSVSDALNFTLISVPSSIVFVSLIKFTDGSTIPLYATDFINSGLCNININYTDTNWNSLGIHYSLP